MKFLLDTHVLLWAALEPGQIVEGVRTMIAAPGSNVSASIVSLWEVAIKQRAGKLNVGVDTLLGVLAPASRIELLPILPQHLKALSDLEVVKDHRDPFDHLLLAQAMAEGMTLVTRDRWFDAYSIPLMRA